MMEEKLAMLVFLREGLVYITQHYTCEWSKLFSWEILRIPMFSLMDFFWNLNPLLSSQVLEPFDFKIWW